MFKSRRKTAKKLLNRQLSEIESLTILNFDSWKKVTDAIIKQYIDEKFITESGIMGHTFELNYDEAEKTSAKKAAKDWLMMKKMLAHDYVERYIKYLDDGGELLLEPNWFQKKKTGELIAMISFFCAIVLPFTCYQGKIQGAAESKDHIYKLKQECDSLRTELINCILNLPKPNDSPKEHSGNEN